MRYLSTFSGIGGFELGIQRASANQPTAQELSRRNTIDRGSTKRTFLPAEPLCIGYSEIDKYAIQTYERHFNHVNYGDITKLDPDQLPDFDLIVGGFPCQAFSVAGKRLGFNETRGTLFFELARILENKRPRHLVFENVKGLLTHDNGKTFQTILGVLTDLGYLVEWQVLNSKDFGVPQNRERIFIVGHLRGECGRKVFPVTNNGGEGTDSRVIGATLTTRYAHSQREGTYIEEGRDEGAKIRRLTPRECERLQGFPDDWTAGVSDTQRYKQCGNAVTVNTVAAVISRLKECLA